MSDPSENTGGEAPDELRRHSEDPAEGAEPDDVAQTSGDVAREHPEDPAEG